MKRGKDDDKIMGPMFPRLHVNDTEKGGPRAPPRNKMALYEQLSVPSQRFNPGVLPRNPTNTSSLVPPSSSSQGSGHERSTFLPLHLHPSTHQTEHTHASYSVLNNSMPQLEQKKKLDEEDFQVPIFVQSNIGHNHSESNNSMDRERDLPLGRPSSGRLMKLQNAGERGQKRTCMASLNSRQEDRAQSEASSKEIVAARERSVKSASHPSVREQSDDLSMRSNIYLTHEHRDHAETNFGRLQKTDVSLQQLRAGSRLENTSHSNDVEEQRSFDDPMNEYENREDNRGGLLQTGNMDKADDVSETSMLDSVSELDISPDDVVGIIGQKHFWKARRAIVNQQRAFAFQVFELHRLIKVQRLIAGSPNLLFEDHAYLGSRSLKGIHSNKLPLDYIVETPPSIVKNKDDLEKPATENAVGKTSLSSVQNGSATSNYRPFSGNLQGTTKMNPPHFPQPSGHQWLVPMISPSEGLVYKPYPGPGPWGEHGSLESTPLMRDLTQAYGVPTSHYHYQGIGFPFFFHGCLPPYGMTVMNPAISGSVEQINPAGPSQLSGGEANFFTQHHHSSSNIPGWRDGIVSNVVKGNELQGSTASSPSKRQGNGAGHAGEGKNLLPLLSTPVIEKVSQSQDIDQPGQVIKVVPHNARSATESAARIFQSIQKERGHY